MAKVASAKTTISREQIAEELIKCKKSPHYFIAKYCKIVHPTRGVIPFALWDFQKQLLNDYMSERYVMSVKSRQVGISTLTACYALWLIMFNKNKTVLVIATQKDIAYNFKDKVLFSYESLPSWLQVSGVASQNRSLFKLQNDSWIKCSAPSEKAVRSEAVSLLVFDEAAFITKMDSLWKAAKPTVSHGGKVFALSSPGGEGNWFHTQTESSRNGSGMFLLREIMWYLVPDRDAAWEREERKGWSASEFAQEYECSFLASGSTVVDAEVLKRVAEELEEPRFIGGIDRGMWLWEDYVPGGTYFMTVDVSRGDSSDFSVANVFRVKGRRFEQVCEYRGKIPLDQFAGFVYDLGEQYGNCMIVGENNNIGNHVMLVLKGRHYPKIYYGKREWDPDEYYDLYRNYEFETGRNAGIYTTSANRPVFVANMEEAVRLQKVVIRSSRLSSELRTFVWNKGKPQASGSNNDDIVMSLCFASWIFLTVFKGGTDNDEENYLDLNSLISCLQGVSPQTLDKFYMERHKTSTVQTVQDLKEYEWLLDKPST